MKFPLIHKHQKPVSHKRMLLTDPNSLIGYRIDDGHIKLMSVLGVGGNGVVYHGVEYCPANAPQLAHPRQYAVKALSKVGLETHQLRLLEREFDLHTRVSDHPHVVTFHGIIEEEDFFFVFLDYLPDGDIFDMIETHRTYVGNDELIKSVFLQLIDAVEYCHGLGVSHRDLKPENILCKNDGTHLLLADFGLGTDRKAVKDYGLGSEPYMAPQCFGGFWQKLGPYSPAQADIWSLGVVLVNLACARNPWHKATEESPIFKNFLLDPNHLLDILPISHELNNILKRMFTINPQARISLRELRVRIRAVQRFTLTDEELRRACPTVKDAVKGAAPAERMAELTPGAPHTVVARKITNLTAEDIERLESEARAEARDAALRQAEDARYSRCTTAEFEDEEDDAVAYPLFLSPVVSPSSTAVSTESKPRTLPSVPPSLDLRFVLSSDEVDDLDSDYDSDTGAESEGPITPESHPAADVDILVVPEIDLDGDCAATDVDNVTVFSAPAKSSADAAEKARRDGVPEVSRGPRRAWWL